MNGRFNIFKHLHLGTYGYQGNNEYYVEDTQTDTVRNVDTIEIVKCVIVKERYGLECSPYFGVTAKDGDIKDLNIKLDKIKNWK